MIEYTLSLYTYVLACLIIGYLPSHYLWTSRTSDGKADIPLDQTILVFAFPVGFLLLNLTVLAACRWLEVGVAYTAPLALAVLLVLNLGLLAVRPSTRINLVDSFQRQGKLLVLIFILILPLSGIHLLWPMLLHGWQGGYAMGSDGAAYIYQGIYLQQHFWGPGSTTSVVPFGYIGRPLTSYIPANALALFPITPFQAHSLSSVMVSFFSALTLGWSAWRFFSQQDMRRPLLLAAIAMGLFAFHFQLYWDGSYMSHYYSLLPFLLIPAYFFLPNNTFAKFGFLSLAFTAAITIYSIGLSLIQAVLLLTTLGMLWLFRHISLKRLLTEFTLTIAALAAANALLFKSESPFFLGNMARGYAASLKSWQNVTVKLGLLPNYTTPDWLSFQFAILLIILLVAYAIYRAIHDSKSNPVYLGLLLSMSAIIAEAALRDKYFFLNKVITYLVPLLLLPLLAGIRPGPGVKHNLLTAAPLVIFVAFAFSGWFMLYHFFYVIADARSTVISDSMINTKNYILSRYPAKNIFAVDNMLERHHITRVLFYDTDWQQNTNSNVWAEFGIDPKAPPSSFKNYNFDMLIVGKSDMDPVDYSANKMWLIGELPGHDIYSAGASLVDFDLSWELAPRPSETVYFRRSSERDAEITFVNGGSHHWLEIDFQLDKDGAPIEIGPANLFTLGNHPLQAISAHTVRATCPDICKDRISRIKLNLPQGMAVTVSGVRFGP